MNKESTQFLIISISVIVIVCSSYLIAIRLENAGMLPAGLLLFLIGSGCVGFSQMINENRLMERQIYDRKTLSVDFKDAVLLHMSKGQIICGAAGGILWLMSYYVSYMR